MIIWHRQSAFFIQARLRENIALHTQTI